MIATALYLYLTPAKKMTSVHSNWPWNLWEDFQRQLEMKLHGNSHKEALSGALTLIFLLFFFRVDETHCPYNAECDQENRSAR